MCCHFAYLSIFLLQLMRKFTVANICHPSNTHQIVIYSHIYWVSVLYRADMPWCWDHRDNKGTVSMARTVIAYRDCDMVDIEGDIWSTFIKKWKLSVVHGGVADYVVENTHKNQSVGVWIKAPHLVSFICYVGFNVGFNDWLGLYMTRHVHLLSFVI